MENTTFIQFNKALNSFNGASKLLERVKVLSRIGYKNLGLESSDDIRSMYNLLSIQLEDAEKCMMELLSAAVKETAGKISKEEEGE